MKKNVTLKDVAAEAGVHVSTASRALDPRANHRVSSDLVELVERASAKLGYRRNSAGYALKTRSSQIVGVVIPDITDPAFSPIIRGIEDALAQRDYVAIIANTDGSERREAELIRMLRGRGVDGLVLASVSENSAAIAPLLAEQLPVVTVNRRVLDDDVPFVVADDAGGMRAMVTHLAALGHRDLATIAGPQHLSTGRERLAGFHAACEGLRLSERVHVVVANTYDESEGERCAELLMATGARFSAVVCANDRLAIGAISALRRRGLECPRDVSVTGFNDIALAERLTPPLTTVRVLKHRLGFEAARMILDLIEGRATDSLALVLPVELVARGSSRPPLSVANLQA